jgi:hypothetical protein
MDVVLAALIASVPATLASMAAWRSARRNGLSIGTPNGDGNAIQILELIKNTVLNHENRLIRIEQCIRSDKP